MYIRALRGRAYPGNAFYYATRAGSVARTKTRLFIVGIYSERIDLQSLHKETLEKLAPFKRASL